jgi:hypothetical protein
MKSITCQQCSLIFKASRNDAKYCSTVCRVKAHNKRHPERQRAKNKEYLRRWRLKQKKMKTSLENQIVASSEVQVVSVVPTEVVGNNE